MRLWRTGPVWLSRQPEQAELSGVDIDTRSDIYSLGALLYELLSRAAPLKEGLQAIMPGPAGPTEDRISASRLHLVTVKSAPACSSPSGR